MPAITTNRSRKVLVVQSCAPVTTWVNELSDETWTWVYFGKEVQHFYKVRQLMGERGRMLNSGEIINRTAAETRSTFINMEQQVKIIGRGYPWTISDTSEKNPYTTDLFYNCCAFVSLDAIFRELETNLLVMCDDWFLGWQVLKRARCLGLASRYLSNRPALNYYPPLLGYLFYRSRQALRWVSCRIAFVREFVRRKRVIARCRGGRSPSTLAQDSEFDTFLVTWVTPSTFSPDRVKEADAFYGQLPKYLQEKEGLKVAYLGIPVAWVHDFEEIVRNVQCAKDAVVLIEECLGIKQALQIAWVTLVSCLAVQGRFKLQDVDVTDFLRNQLREDRAKERQCWAAQFYHVANFLSRVGIQPKLIIHSYENQPWEKALRKGMKQIFPAVRIVGYLGVPISFEYMSLFPSQGELEQGETPDRIVTIGRRWKNVLREHGYPKGVLRIGPALRYGHILARVRGTRTDRSYRKRWRKSILVAGSFGFTETAELMTKVVEAVENKGDVKVIVKFHPSMAGDGPALVKCVLDALGRRSLPAHIEVTERRMSDLMGSVDLVIYKGTSVAYEALAYNLPVLFVGSDIWFDMDRASGCSHLVARARSSSEIRAAIDKLLREDRLVKEERWKAVQAVLEEAFYPTREDTLRCFFDFDVDTLERASGVTRKSGAVNGGSGFTNGSL